MSEARVLQRILSGAADQNVRFADLRRVLLDIGFDERIRGSHHIYARTGVEEILNLQPANGGKAKPYQVKQVRQVILKYKLAREAGE